MAQYHTLTDKFDRSLLTFDPIKHRHFYDGRQLYGVTTVLGIISKGDGLIQWGVNQAVDYINSQLQNGLEGYSLDDVQTILSGAKYAWRGARQEAADIGTMAHNWIEGHLKGSQDDFPEHPQARNSCEAAVKWLEQHKWKTIDVEKQVCLPSLNIGGICDWWAYIDGVPAVPDWKTSKGIYSSYRYQTAVYAKAIEAETGERVRERWILRIDKNTGEFEDLHLPASELAADFKAFKNAAELYHREQELKKGSR